MAEPARKLELRDAVACRGLRREVAARYVGVSPTKFDQLVLKGEVPQPMMLGGVKIWDRLALDAVFSDGPSVQKEDEWDKLIG